MEEEKKLTGYPSIDKPWLKYYKKGANDKALSTPMDKTLYRFYIEKVFINPNFPVVKYFNTSLTTKQFLDSIEMWARAFRAVGVNEDEMVPIYGTWCPEIAAIFFALNAIGAYPYFEKLDITESALRLETQGAKIAVVFEPLWNDVAKAVFHEDRFRKVFIIGLTDSMRFPLKQLIRLKKGYSKRAFADSDKFILTDQIKRLAKGFSGPFEVPFKKNRIAVITTSSGTTSSVVKGIMDTNEGALANVIGTAYSEPGFIAEKECLITLPPTASTATNCFFLLPLYMGMTVRLDPRADEESWPKLLLKYKPSLAATTGSFWYSFYRKMADLRKEGRDVDLSFLDTFILGGSGVTPEQLDFINHTAKECKVKTTMDCGYGCSEFFGVITVDKHEVDYKPTVTEVIDVGIPIPGATVAIFDQNGNELPYGKRGEIWAKGPSIMHGYFGKPDLAEQAFHGKWLKTGDIGVIDENGYVYCYGRMKSSVKIQGETVYLFDVANTLRRELGLEDCMVEVKNLTDGNHSVVVYYVQKSNWHQAEAAICSQMNVLSKKMGITVDGYREFKESFPISPTSLKPRTRYTEGFVNYLDSGEKISISYSYDEKTELWTIINQ
ncbi:MAG: long-chain fatty acid--CoA ligase [Oscillospiraceae bacterium]|nr:long-chain fatty acid--CoA ligase [Oscillospiraceae bacterium]